MNRLKLAELRALVLGVGLAALSAVTCPDARHQIRGRNLTFLSIVAVLSGVPERLLAQDRPAPIVEAVVGRSGFIDEVWDYFTTVGGGARWFVTPRLAIGPEVSYLSGKFDSLDASSLIITGNLTFDFIGDDGKRSVVPYLAAGGGYMRQKTLVGTGPGSTRIAVTLGIRPGGWPKRPTTDCSLRGVGE